MSLRIEHCRIISPGTDVSDATLRIDKDGRISDEPPSADDEILDAGGRIAVPGFFDIHTHGRSNADFSDGTPEAFQTVGEGKIKDGVTSFLATTLTLDESEIRKTFESAVHYAETNRTGAILEGIHLEGPFIHPDCAGAQNPAFLKKPDIRLVDELNAIFPIRKVSYSPELDPDCRFAHALVERGIMPSGAHSTADYETFERARQAGMKHLTHFCNVMTPLHHLRPGMVGGGLLRDDVSVEIICDGVHLRDEMIRIIARIKPIDRIMLITDSIRAAGMPDGNYSLGGLPVFVNNGRATLGNGAVAGSTLRYFNGLRKFAALAERPLRDIIRTTSLNQAESLGINHLGRLEKNNHADIVLLDDSFRPQGVIVRGRILQKEF